jgi:ABC-type phosphate/phosphonate transport system substrate-binding protein
MTIAALFSLLGAASLCAGATGEEALGSEERPLIWAVSIETIADEALGNIERSLVAFELEAGLSIDLFVSPSYDAILTRLERGEVHLALLPPLTWLVAAERGSVVAGPIGKAASAQRDVEVIVTPGFAADSWGSLDAVRIARFDPLAHEGWLLAKLVAESSSPGASARFETIDLESTRHVLEAVRDGLADVGIVSVAAREGIAPEFESLEPFARIEGPTEFMIAFHPLVPQPLREQISTLLVGRPVESGPFEFLGRWFGIEEIIVTPADFADRYELLVSGSGLSPADLP